jgi:hypothetical protein
MPRAPPPWSSSHWRWSPGPRWSAPCGRVEFAGGLSHLLKVRAVDEKDCGSAGFGLSSTEPVAGAHRDHVGGHDDQAERDRHDRDEPARRAAPTRLQERGSRGRAPATQQCPAERGEGGRRRRAPSRPTAIASRIGAAWPIGPRTEPVASAKKAAPDAATTIASRTPSEMPARRAGMLRSRSAMSVRWTAAAPRARRGRASGAGPAPRHTPW